MTVATPLPFVTELPAERVPPPLDDQLTVTPLVATAFPLVSASCASIVTLVPATGASELDVTTNFAAEPAVNVTVAVSVSEAPLSVPAIVALPAVTEDVNVAV